MTDTPDTDHPRPAAWRPCGRPPCRRTASPSSPGVPRPSTAAPCAGRSLRPLALPRRRGRERHRAPAPDSRLRPGGWWACDYPSAPRCQRYRVPTSTARVLPDGRGGQAPGRRRRHDRAHPVRLELGHGRKLGTRLAKATDRAARHGAWTDEAGPRSPGAHVGALGCGRLPPTTRPPLCQTRRPVDGEQRHHGDRSAGNRIASCARQHPGRLPWRVDVDHRTHRTLNCPLPVIRYRLR